MSTSLCVTPTPQRWRHPSLTKGDGLQEEDDKRSLLKVESAVSHFASWWLYEWFRRNSVVRYLLDQPYVVFLCEWKETFWTVVQIFCLYVSKAKLKITFEGVDTRFYVFPHTRPEQEKHAARSVSPGSRRCRVTRSPGPRTPGWDDIFIAGKMNITCQTQRPLLSKVKESLRKSVSIMNGRGKKHLRVQVKIGPLKVSDTCFWMGLEHDSPGKAFWSPFWLPFPVFPQRSLP